MTDQTTTTQHDDHNHSSNSKSPAAKPRKRSPRGKGIRTNTVASTRLKELWATPEFREKMKRRDQKRIEAAKLNPAKFNRHGVPDGMRRAEAEPLWAQANLLADRFIQILKDKGELPNQVEVATNTINTTAAIAPDAAPIVIPETDEGKAEAALREAFVLAMGPSRPQVRIHAINTVLNYTAAKPESRTTLMLGQAEDFLTAITATTE
jgi:hypothetical protein